MRSSRAGGTNALHAIAMAVVVVVTAFVVGFVVFDLEGSVLPGEKRPDASFRFAYDEGEHELVVTHYGGDNLDPERVVVLNQGFEEIASWPADESVSAGDATTVASVTERDTIYVMWKTTDGTYVTLATWNEDAYGSPLNETTTTPTTAGTASVAASVVAPVVAPVAAPVAATVAASVVAPVAASVAASSTATSAMAAGRQ